MDGEKVEIQEKHTVYKSLYRRVRALLSFVYSLIVTSVKFILCVLVILLLISAILTLRRGGNEFSGPGASQFGFRSGVEFVKNSNVEANRDWVANCSYSEKVRSEIKLYFDPGQHNRLSPFLKVKTSETSGKNFIFYGEPGTGKSRCALLIAEHISSFYTIVAGGTLEKIYVGSGARAWEEIVSTAKEKAKNAERPVVIIVEEIDSLAGCKSRSHAKDHTLVNTFLESVDSIRRDNSNIIILGTTNVLDSMEMAAIRTGRFNRLHFEYPNVAGLASIVSGVRKQLENKYNIVPENFSSPGVGNYEIVISNAYWSNLENGIMRGLSAVWVKDKYPVTFVQISSSVEKIIKEKISKFQFDSDNKKTIILEESLGSKTGDYIVKISSEEASSLSRTTRIFNNVRSSSSIPR